MHLLLVVSAVASIFGLPLLCETYAPVIRMRRALKNGDLEKAAELHPDLLQSSDSKLRTLWYNLYRPIEILCRSAICFMLSLYMAL